MADAVTGLRLSQGDQVLGERPELTAEDRDAQAFSAIAGDARKGFRSAVSSVGGGALRLAGDIGESLGMRDFAAKRFAEAEDYVAFAHEVGPSVRDYRAVKDITDAVNFTAGLLGQAGATFLPAIAGGAVGARLGGLRGAVAGAFGASTAMNAGEQATRIKDSGASAPNRVANALGAGALAGALDTAVPAAGLAKVARAATTGAKGAGALKTAALATGAEAATEGAQEALGQAGHSLLEPGRDKLDDTPAIINATLGGAVGGLGFGAGTAGLTSLSAGYGKLKDRSKVDLDPTRAQTPDEVRSAIGRVERPMDPDDISGAPDDMDQVPAWLEERDGGVTKNLGGWYERMKDQPWAKKYSDMTDPEQQKGFHDELKGKIEEVVDKPRTRGMAEKFKGFAQKLAKSGQTEGKSSQRLTALDLAVFDNMLSHLDPEKAAALSPTQKRELSQSLKSYMLTSFRQRDPVEGPGAPQDVRGFERQAPSIDPTKDLDKRITHLDAKRAEGKTRIEGERQTVPAQVPHELMDLFGDRLEPLFATTDKLLRSAGEPLRKVDYKKGLEGARKVRESYRTKLEETVESALRDEYLDPSVRKTAVTEVTRWMTKQVTEGPEDWKEFDRKVQTFFGDRSDEIIEAFDKERGNLTRGYEHFVDQNEEFDEATGKRLSDEEIEERLAMNQGFRVTREDEEGEEAAAVEVAAEEEVPEDSPYRDVRLNKEYEEMKEAPRVLAALKNDYKERDVKFRAEPVLEDYEVEEGGKKVTKQRMTGKVRITAEDAQASPEYTEEQWAAIEDKHGKSGVKHGVITVTRKTDKTDKMPVKVSMPNLVAETMRSIGRAGAGPDFVYDMLLRGLSNLMSDPKFTGFSKLTQGELEGGLKIPDDAVVYHDKDSKKNWTWGELSSRAREGTRQNEREYWQRVVSHLNRLAVEFRARRKQNPDHKDERMAEYTELRAAVEREQPGAKDLYNRFVKDWAQEREEYASGYASDEREPMKGMIGINSIEDAFYRDRRLDMIEKTVKEKQARIKNNMVERPEGFQERNRSLAATVRRLKREETRLRQGLSSTLRENEIEQTSRRGTEPTPRNVQEETRLPLVGNEAVRPHEPTTGGEVTEMTKKLTPKERRRRDAGQGVLGESRDEIVERRKRDYSKDKGPKDTNKFSFRGSPPSSYSSIEAGLRNDAGKSQIAFNEAHEKLPANPDKKQWDEYARLGEAAFYDNLNYVEAQINRMPQLVQRKARTTLEEALDSADAWNQEVEKQFAQEKPRTMEGRATAVEEEARKRAIKIWNKIEMLHTISKVVFRDANRSRPKSASEPVIGGEPGGDVPFSLRATQTDALFKRMSELDGREWQNYTNTIRNSTNVEALGDTLDFLASEDFEKKWRALGDNDEVVDRVLKRGDVLFNDIEDRLAELGGPDGRPKGGLSEMRVGAQKISDADKKAVREHVSKVLGPEARVRFFTKLEQDAAGIFQTVGGEERILVSLRALDPRGVGFHETMHALVARLREDNPRAASTLLAAAGSPKIVAQLRRLLADEPAALEQLKDAEERLAYMYEFWAAGKLEMGPKADGVFAKIRNWLGGLLSAWTELSADTKALPKAEEIVRAFHSGALAERSAAGRVLDKIAPPPSDHFLAKWGDLASKVFFTADGYIRSFKIPALTAEADKMFSPPEQQGNASGMMQTKHIQRNKFMNRYVKIVEGMSDAQIEAMRAELSGDDPTAGRTLSPQAAATRALLKDVFDYMEASGVKVVEYDPGSKAYKELPIKYAANYVPRVYDKDKILADWDGFKAMLKRNGIPLDNAEEIASSLVKPSKADPNESDATTGLVFYAPNTMHRKLNVPDSELRPYLENNMGAVMYKYINYTVRRAEYAKRFGNQGEQLALAVEKAKAEGATDEQITSFNHYVQAMEGSLGNRIDPRLRGFFGGVMTYQNLRLLPLAIFSSLVDPMGIMVRGGTVGQSFKAFARGMKELVKDSQDEARELAKTVGSINAASDEQMMADAYGANFTKSWQRWMNKKLFQLNGMESWNTSMRIAGTAAAQDFIIKHVQRPNEHSERYLSELGLSKDDVTIVKSADGSRDLLDLTPAVVDAMNKWVDGAVLRPHAGIRPIWMSDPRWMLVSHLKQFTYSFHKAIVARAVHEAGHGNVAPVMAMLSYVPMIVAADLLRGLVTPGGADDDRLEKWSAADWLAHGVSRAGITGPGQYALDATRDLSHGGFGIESVGGPSVQQLIDVLRAAASPAGDLGREALRAIPPVPAMNLRI